MKQRCMMVAMGLLLAVSAAAADRISATVTITNVPVDDDTILVNSSLTRYWETTVAAAATNILIGADVGYCATNLLTHAGGYPFGAGVITRQTDTNVVVITALPGDALAVTLSGTWGSLVMSTQTVATAKAVVAPLSAIATASERTNIASQVVSDLDTYSTTAFGTGTTLLANYVDLSTAQTVTGAKSFTASGQLWDGGRITNTVVGLAQIDYLTNAAGVQFFDSTATRSTAISPDANGVPSLYDVYSGTAVGAPGTALDWTPSAENLLNVNAADKRYGQLAAANTWTATNSFTQITNTTITGSTITGATIDGAIGAGQITSGTLDGVTVQNSDIVDALSIDGTVDTLSGGMWTNAILTTVTATNLTVEDELYWPRLDHTSLASGDNSGVDFGDAVYVRIASGPAADFTIHGIAGGSDGRVLVIQNDVTWDMTIADESGVEPTAANRIQTHLGADATYVDESVVTLVYDGSASRWVLVGSSEPASQAFGELYEVSAGGSTITVVTAGSYYQWTTGLVGIGSGADLAQPSAVTDDITIGDSGAGTYHVTVSASVGGTASSLVTMEVFQGGIGMGQLSAAAVLDASGNRVSLSASGLLSCSSGETFDLRFTSDTSGNVVTVYRCDLSLHRVD